MSQRRVRVVSYRRVFRTDWRIRQVWDFDLTKISPGGIPAKMAAWVFMTVLVVYVLSHTPVAKEVVGLVPGWFRYGSLSVLVAFASRQEAPDGRSIHTYGWARFVQALRGSPASEEPWVRWDTDLPVRWDGSGSTLHRGRVLGPCKVSTTQPVRVGNKKTNLTFRADQNGETTFAVIKADEFVEVYG